jgi:membrane peptidoglycan carboxypeptidase
MRTGLAIVVFLGGILSLISTADADRKRKRSAKPSYLASQKHTRAKEQHSRITQEQLACEERARHEDPTGRYAGYPCWAREALARGANIPPD